jgi:two-component system response regulator PfeR
MTKANVLIIEDDITLNNQLATLLRREQYGVEQCFDGSTGLAKAKEANIQLVLLDVLLPSKDGFSVLNSLRKSSQIPVIIVSAKGAEQERIMGLSKGADDYMAKPFNTQELLLRIEALLRRSNGFQSKPSYEMFIIDGLNINRVEKRVEVNHQLIEMTPIQFKLLWELVVNQGELLSKSYLSQTVLNKALGAHDRSLDMHLSRIRRKLSEANWPGERLQTVHGKGYCLS